RAVPRRGRPSGPTLPYGAVRRLAKVFRRARPPGSGGGESGNSLDRAPPFRGGEVARWPAAFVPGQRHIVPPFSSQVGPPVRRFLWLTLAGLVLAPAAARAEPAVDLDWHEKHGGHLLARHVGKTKAELAARLAKESVSAASSFSSRKAAEEAVAAALK